MNNDFLCRVFHNVMSFLDFMVEVIIIAIISFGILYLVKHAQ
jgi:hypothetical protein